MDGLRQIPEVTMAFAAGEVVVKSGEHPVAGAGWKDSPRDPSERARWHWTHIDSSFGFNPRVIRAHVSHAWPMAALPSADNSKILRFRSPAPRPSAVDDVMRPLSVIRCSV